MSDKVPHPKSVEQVESIDESGSPLVEDAQQGSPSGGSGLAPDRDEASRKKDRE